MISNFLLKFVYRLMRFDCLYNHCMCVLDEIFYDLFDEYKK